MKTNCYLFRIFTLVELLIVITVIMILTGLLLSSLKIAKEAGKRISCSNNLKQLTVGIIFYTSDHQFFFPTWSYSGYLETIKYPRWNGVLGYYGYLPMPGKSGSIHICMSNPYNHYDGASSSTPTYYNCNYSYNAELGYDKFDASRVAGPVQIAKIRRPSTTGAILEGGDRGCTDDPTDTTAGFRAKNIPNGSADYWSIVLPHTGTMSSAWVDGHVKSIKPQDLIQDDFIPVSLTE